MCSENATTQPDNPRGAYDDDDGHHHSPCSAGCWLESVVVVRSEFENSLIHTPTNKTNCVHAIAWCVQYFTTKKNTRGQFSELKLCAIRSAPPISLEWPFKPTVYATTHNTIIYTPRRTRKITSSIYVISPQQIHREGIAQALSNSMLTGQNAAKYTSITLSSSASA